MVDDPNDGNRESAPENRQPDPLKDILGVIQIGNDLEFTDQTFPQEKLDAAFQLLDIEQPLKRERPQGKRRATVLILDSISYKNPHIREELKSALYFIAQSQKFDISEDHEGNLFIVSYAERGGTLKLLDFAKYVCRQRPGARIYLKDVEIEAEREGGFSISNFPEGGANSLWRKTTASSGRNIFLDSELSAQLQDRRSRKGSHIRIETQPVTLGAEKTASFEALISHKPRVRHETGGPDKLIGYDTEEFQALMGKFMPDDETRLVVLEAHAGFGKSRMVTEIAREIGDQAVIHCSIEEGDIPGAGLVTVANQIIAAFGGDEILGTESLSTVSAGVITYKTTVGRDGQMMNVPDISQTTTLKDFSELPDHEKIEFAAKHAKTLEQLCANALKVLNTAKADHTLFVLEDIHHADLRSLPHLMNIVRGYIRDTEKGKVLIAHRQDETYQIPAVERGINDVAAGGQNRVNRETLKGLDFEHDEALAHEFVFHCLPEHLRTWSGGRSTRIDGWHKELARIAKDSPWRMTTLVGLILANPQNLTVDEEGNIILNRDIIAELERVTDDTEFNNHIHQKIAALNKGALHVLQCIALMGGTATRKQIIEIARQCPDETFEVPVVDADQVVEILNLGFYMRQTDVDTFALQHDLMTEIVLGTLPYGPDRAVKANNVYEVLQMEHPHPEAKHHLTTHIAAGNVDPNTPSQDLSPENTFWTEYLNDTKACLHDAECQNDALRGYKTACRVLDQGVKCVEQAIEALKNPVAEVPESLKNLVIISLLAKAENGVKTRKFDEAENALAKLNSIHDNFITPQMRAKAHLIKFERAYIQNSAGDMKKIFEEDLRNGAMLGKAGMDPEIAIALKIKLAFKEGRLADAMAIVEEGDNAAQLSEFNRRHQENHAGTPSPLFIDIARMVSARIPFEAARNKIYEEREDGKIHDGDVMTHPKASEGGEESQTLNQMREALRQIDKTETLLDTYPTLLDQSIVIQLMDQKAATEAHFGNYEEAIAIFDEIINLARHINDPVSGARARKMKGDIQVMEALSLPMAEFLDQRETLKDAIQTYTMGLETIGIANHVYQAILRIQRIRGISRLIATYGNFDMSDSAKRAHRNHLRKFVEMALQDFREINENKQWAAFAMKKSISIYYSGLPMGWILNLKKALKIEEEEWDIIPEEMSDTEKYPLMKPEKVREGLDFAKHHVVDTTGLEELAFKIRGGEKLLSAFVA